ncbi:MAG: aldo/keto reductase [Myxococcota bacterium]|nr:aldo/keto reductase [Myxococcota bacterium]
MDTRKIGKLDVSVIGLGCNNFGWRIDEAQTREVVHAALDAGINFFDTADTYGQTKSEELLGMALAGKRNQAIIATKFGMQVTLEKRGAKPEYIRQAVEDSLRRLKVETIDLYQLHTPDPETPIDDTMEALGRLVEAGKVREIGCSNFDVPRLQSARASVREGGPVFVSVQNEYSMMRRDPEAGVLEECRRQGARFLPYFPLASGVLSGKYSRGKHPAGTRVEKGGRYDRYLTPQSYDLIDRAGSWAADHKHSLLDLAFAWLLGHEEVASVIAGATTVEQVKANGRAGMWRLTLEEHREVDMMLDDLGFRAPRPA